MDQTHAPEKRVGSENEAWLERMFQPHGCENGLTPATEKLLVLARNYQSHPDTEIIPNQNIIVGSHIILDGLLETVQRKEYNPLSVRAEDSRKMPLQ